ncbi:MAG: enoyl-CoA hydratase-related protein [Pseudomonadota bacterium]
MRAIICRSCPARRKVWIFNLVTFETLLYAVDKPVATITLNRPEKLNALSAQLLEELEAAFNAATRDDDVKVLVVAGAGRAFSAGYDFNEKDWIISQYPADYDGAVDAIQDRDDIEELLARWMRLFKCPKPVIVKVHGICLSGAGELLAISDLVVAGESAQFGHPAARDLGVPPTLFFWPMLIGMRKTKEMMFTGKLISAHEGERLGLINHVVPDDELDAAVAGLAADVAKTTSDALKISKIAINRWYENMGLQASVQSTSDLDAFFHQSKDYVEFFKGVREDGLTPALKKRAKRFE